VNTYNFLPTVGAAELPTIACCSPRRTPRYLLQFACPSVSPVAVWLSGDAVVSINEVALRRARLVVGWVTVSGVQLPVQENLSQYIIRHPGQLNLVIPPWVGATSTSDGCGPIAKKTANSV